MTTRDISKRRDHNRKTENFSNEARYACLRPYNIFLSLQTYSGSCETPRGGVI
jgi:hypothetical protein